MVEVTAEPYAFEFQPPHAALLIIDMQRDFLEPGGFGESLGNDVALLLGSKLFELTGTRAVLEHLNLDIFWRNGRTHTLHDPVRWKYAIVGNYALNGINPPLHAWS